MKKYQSINSRFREWKEKKGVRQLLYANLANLLTFSRFFCTLLLLVVMKDLYETNYSNRKYICFICLCVVIWASDYFDGKVARRLKIESEFGTYFDLVVDCIFVFSVHIELLFYGIMPVWFLFVMIEKIVNYIVTSKLIGVYSNASFAFIRDFAGRMVSASFFVTPFILCSIEKYCMQSKDKIVLLLVIITCFAVYSSLSRIIYTILGAVRKHQVEKKIVE